MLNMSIKLVLIILFLSVDIQAYEFPQHNDNISIIKEKIENSEIYRGQEIKPVGNSELYYFEDGQDNIFVTKDGRFFIKGNIIQFINNSFSNYELNKELSINNFNLLSIIDEDSLITYGDLSSNNKIYVFMDYTCPFCYKFHNMYLNLFKIKNIKVVYIPFSRSNDNNIKNNLVDIFCLKDKEEAKKEIDKAFNLKESYVSIKKCENPYQYENLLKMGSLMNIKGTPAVFDKYGHYIGGMIDFNLLYNQIKE